MVRKYPHEVTIYEGGPMTNLAVAISIDPEFPALAQELVFMGGSLDPETDDPEFARNPTHEFNFWFDPEAAVCGTARALEKDSVHADRYFPEDARHAPDDERD